MLTTVGFSATQLIDVFGIVSKLVFPYILWIILVNFWVFLTKTLTYCPLIKLPQTNRHTANLGQGGISAQEYRLVSRENIIKMANAVCNACGRKGELNFSPGPLYRLIQLWYYKMYPCHRFKKLWLACAWQQELYPPSPPWNLQLLIHGSIGILVPPSLVPFSH